MSASPQADWQAANTRDLGLRLARMRGLLLAALGRPTPPPAPAADSAVLTALPLAAAMFNLSPFETDLLLLCAGVEMDTATAGLVSELEGGSADRPHSAVTFALALSVLPDPHWSALAATAPLRYWRLLHPRDELSLAYAPLRIDERILHFLAGVSSLDRQIAPFLIDLGLDPAEIELAAGSGSGAGSLAAELAALIESPRPPVIALTGADLPALALAGAAGAAKAGRRLVAMRAADLPHDPRERSELARLWAREALLSGAVLLVESGGDTHALETFGAFAAEGNFPIFLASDAPVAVPTPRAVRRVIVEQSSANEQVEAWLRALGPLGQSLNGAVPALAAQFRLSPGTLRAVVDDAFAGLPGGAASSADGATPSQIQERLWNASRRQARPALDDLGRRIENRRGWEDLVLPAAQLDTLHEIVAHVAQRQKVYETWGFGQHARGTGTSVIFAGASGTGKTLAAEVLANALNLDLYQVDLSGVVNKYIGETEKNLRRIFHAAETGGVILLFDEADALFGRRSEVRDSHDRYANIEVSYLLQQMESHRGLAILTTNMLENFDPAFLRRVRYVVQFPFPAEEQRALIWQRMFPQQAPTRGIDLHKLARLDLTGGSIRNITVNSAFLAAQAGEPIGMRHLLRAAASEYGKLEKPLPASEVADWVAG
jgi:hypothetical protein